METKLFCPLGSQCEEAKDGAVHRCMWYTQVRGIHPQTGEEIDEWNCAMAWIPILTIDNSQQSRATGAAVESFRNEMVEGNNLLMALANQQKKSITEN